jgi:hypothetical protein
LLKRLYAKVSVRLFEARERWKISSEFISFAMCPQMSSSLPRCFENAFLAGDAAQLQESAVAATDCVRSSTLQFATTVLLPAVHRLLSSPASGVSNAMFAHLPRFAQALHDRFPREFPALADSFLLPTVYETLQLRASLRAPAAEALSAILALTPVDRFTSSLFPQIEALLSDSACAPALCALLCALAGRAPELWFDGLHAALAALALPRGAAPAAQARLPALLADLLLRVADRGRRVRLLAVAAELARSGRCAVLDAVARELPDIAGAVGEPALLLPIARAVFGAGDRCGALGPLLAALGAPADAALLAQYCRALADADAGADAGAPADRAFAAAFSFSAVALAFGRAGWPALAAAFTAALGRDRRVRRTLAFALASFAFAVPPAELQRAATWLLSDIPAVAEGVLASLDQVAALVPNPGALLFALQRPRERYAQWRMRRAVSQQLRYCSGIFDRAALREIAEELARDGVAAVRVDAASSVACLWDQASVAALERMADDDCHFVRQTAARICRELPAEAREHCRAVIARLAKDRVEGVRAYAAEALAESPSECL